MRSAAYLGQSPHLGASVGIRQWRDLRRATLAPFRLP